MFSFCKYLAFLPSHVRYDNVLQLREVPGLTERMASLMCVDVDLDSDSEEVNVSDGGSDENGVKFSVVEIVEKEVCKAKEEGNDTVWLELEELDIDDAMLVSLDLPSKFPVCYNSKLRLSLYIACNHITPLTKTDDIWDLFSFDPNCYSFDLVLNKVMILLYGEHTA